MKNIKELNVWNYMHKVSEKEEAKMTESEKLNLLTDGFGNIYLPSNVGATPLCKLDGDDSFLYRYNFETKEIEAFVQRPAVDCNCYEWVESMSLGVEYFADNPEYWVREFAKSLQDAHYQEAEEIAQQSAESFLFDEYEDKDEYKYMIKAQVSFNLPDDFDYDDQLIDVEEEYSKYISSLSKKTSLYTEPLEISCSFSSNSYCVYINCNYTMPMTKEDLMDIWDEYETLIINPDGLSYTTNIEDLEMVEV